MLTVASFEAVVNVILSENDRIHELPDEEIDVVLGCKLSLRKEGVSTTCADVAWEVISSAADYVNTWASAFVQLILLSRPALVVHRD